MKLDIKLLGYVNVFENKTHTVIKDCFFDKHDNLVFVVQHGFGYKAVGKSGSMVKKLNLLFKRRIRIIEFNENPVIFVKNALYPLKPMDVALRDDNIVISAENTQQRGLLIGRDKQNLNNLKQIVSKFFKNEIIIE